MGNLTNSAKLIEKIGSLNVTKVGASAPSNPVEGNLWYDTTNDVLKSYDGTNWNDVSGDEAIWGNITGTLSDQTDLQAALDAKVGSSNNTINNVVHLSQADYDALQNPDNNTWYSTPDNGSGGFDPENAGSVGQVVTKTATGYAYADAPVKSVNGQTGDVTISTPDIYYASVYGEMGGHKLGTDTTYEEVKAAYNAGKILLLKYYSTSSMRIYDFDGAYEDTESPQGYMIFYFYSKHDNRYYKIGYSTSGWETLSGNVSSSEVLTKTNTTSYTPSANYHPATKKYVDDKVTVLSGDSGTTYTIKTSSTAPAAGTANNIITFVTQ